MKNLALILFLLVVSCNKQDFSICDPLPGFTVYSVKEGRHDFLPNDQVLNIGNPVFKFELILDSSMWWDYDGDQDYFDISKISGFTDASNANNRTSSILGWRPLKDNRNKFELFGFVNHKDSSFDFKKIGVYGANELLFCSISWIDNEVEFSIHTQSNELKSQKLEVLNDGVKSYREIGGWFGGNDNAPNKMCFWFRKVEIEI